MFNVLLQVNAFGLVNMFLLQEKMTQKKTVFNISKKLRTIKHCYTKPFMCDTMRQSYLRQN